jgi:AcrR family transcriptional regulator
MSPVPRLSRPARRAQLLDVALTLFAERGYHAASISDIIGKAKVARGTFYNHFRSKREIFAQLLDRLFEQVNASVSPIRPEPGAGVDVQMRANIESICRTLQDNLPMGRVLLEQAVGLDEGGREQLKGFYIRVLDRLERAVIVGQALGIVRSGDPSLLTICTLAMIKETLYQRIIGTRLLPLEMVVTEIFACMQHGILRSTAP